MRILVSDAIPEHIFHNSCFAELFTVLDELGAVGRLAVPTVLSGPEPAALAPNPTVGAALAGAPLDPIAFAVVGLVLHGLARATRFDA